MRTTVRDTQLAEQLVEVPTIVSWSLLQLIMEQNVDIPVPGRGGRISGLHGFPSGQSSTALHSSEERISDRIVEQTVDFPGGGLQDFRPGLCSSSSLHVPAGISEVLDEPGEGFFRPCAQTKKCGLRTLPESEGARQRQPIHAGSSASNTRFFRTARSKRLSHCLIRALLGYCNSCCHRRSFSCRRGLAAPSHATSAGPHCRSNHQISQKQIRLPFHLLTPNPANVSILLHQRP